MYLVYGSRVVRRRVGRRGDFCPLCRSFQALHVNVLENVDHFYFVPIGGRSPAGFETTCEGCGLVREVEPGETPGTSGDPGADVESLLAETNPGARSDWAERLEFERRLAAGAVSGDERDGAIDEPFALADGILARRMAETQFDGASRVGCLGLVVATAGTYLLASELMTDLDASVGLTAAVAAGLGLAFLIVFAGDVRRHARSRVLPALARGLRPFRPSHGEIDAILAEYRARRAPLGTALKADEVVAAIMAHDP